MKDFFSVTVDAGAAAAHIAVKTHIAEAFSHILETASCISQDTQLFNFFIT